MKPLRTLLGTTVAHGFAVPPRASGAWSGDLVSRGLQSVFASVTARPLPERPEILARTTKTHDSGRKSVKSPGSLTWGAEPLWGQATENKNTIHRHQLREGKNAEKSEIIGHYGTFYKETLYPNRQPLWFKDV